jgi:TIR domain
MRILQIDQGGDEFLQGFVRAEWPQRASIAGGQAVSWIRMFMRSASLWSQVKPLSAAVRMAIEPGRPVTTVHSFVVAARDEARLRMVLAAFMRTDQMGGGHTEGLQDGEDLAERFVHQQEPRLAIVVGETLHTANGLAIHHNLRLADQLPRLLQTFADLGISFAYEIQAMPWTPPREELRQFLHNVSRLLDTPGIPARLAQDQTALGERIKQATFNIEECISTPSAEFTDAVADTLSGVLGETLYGEFYAAPNVAPLQEDVAEAFAHHVHSRVMLNLPVERADLTGAARREEVDRCLSCLPLGFNPAGNPPTEPEPLALSLAPGPAAPPAGGTSLSVRGRDDRPFAFISYARSDSNRVYPLVEELMRIGVSVWIDRRIVGGDDWVVELENQLLRCSGILAFITSSFVGSKYCGREIRFGDALNKKIIPIFLEYVELSGGLNFILNATQRLMLLDKNDSGDILSAIKAHMPIAADPAMPS